MNSARRLLSRGSWPEASRIADVLRQETVGGILLLIATTAALITANTGGAYAKLRDTVIGPASLELDLSIGAWAADGLLAIFFFVVGLELKREFVAGDLRDPARAALPIVAAVGGMIAPAVIFIAVNGPSRGWAIPVATDIAFALAVLAVISTHLPSALRTFLLTLAVVDDLLAITIIAIFYTSDLQLTYLLAALVPLAAFGALAQARNRAWYLLIPLGLVTWGLMHASGVHATVAGVLLGFTIPVLASKSAKDDNGERVVDDAYAERLEDRVRPISSAIAVPVFAFFSAGVAVGGADGLTSALSQRITLGVITGLFVGKTIGVFTATWLMSKFTRAELDNDLSWYDILGLSMLAGVGFTVSLLIGELAFGAQTSEDELAKVGVLLGSLVSATAATVVLKFRDRKYRAWYEQEQADSDSDGVPDVYDTHPDDPDRD